MNEWMLDDMMASSGAVDRRSMKSLMEAGVYLTWLALLKQLISQPS